MAETIIKLKIRLQNADESAAIEKSFDQGKITIGRGEENTLAINSRFISRCHTRINRVRDAYEITDLGSANATFVNNQVLVSNKPSPLRLGDEIRIGDHVLIVFGIEPRSSSFAAHESDSQSRAQSPPQSQSASRPQPEPEPEPQPDSQSASHAEPDFNTQSRSESQPNLRQTLSQIVEEYASELNKLGRSHLEQALQRLAPLLRESAPQPENEVVSRLRDEVIRVQEENRQLQVALASKSDQVVDRPPRPLPGDRTYHDDRMMGVLRQFFLVTSRLSSGRMSFLQEFVRDSMIWKDLILNSNEEDFIRSLLDPHLTDEKIRSGKEKLDAELADLVGHSMALLQGYRDSAAIGARRMLAYIDPMEIQRTLEGPHVTDGRSTSGGQAGFLGKYLPFTLAIRARWIAWKRMKELVHEDRGVLEKRYFRQAFAQAYKDSLRSDRGERKGAT